MIHGENLDTGRSNMTGKTTLIDAIFWTLFGYLPKWGGPKGGSADAVVKRGEGRCHCVVELESAGSKVRIRRERPARLRIWINGKEQDGKKADFDSRIPELIGMSSSQFLLSVYVSQDRQTSFFTMGDTERAKLLSIIAGLDNFNRALERSKEMKVLLQSEMDRVQGSLDVLAVQIAEIPSRQNELQERISIQTRDLALLSSQVSGKTGEINRRRTELRQESDMKIASLKSDLADRLQELNREYAALLSERHRLQQTIQGLPKVEAELIEELSQTRRDLEMIRNIEAVRDTQVLENERLRERIQAELNLAESMREGICPQCKQLLPESERELRIKEHLERAEALAKEMHEVGPASECESLVKREREIQDQVVRRQAELDAEPNRIRTELRSYDEKARRIKSESQSEEHLVQVQIGQIERHLSDEVHKMDHEIRDEERRVSQKADELKALERELARLSDQFSDLEQKVTAARESLALGARRGDLILDLMDLFGPKGFRSVCFEGLIDRIGTRASQLLSLMTDGVYSTRIDQIGETSRGEERLILRPIISKGGVEVPSDDLSGGARRMAMLAYDVAVSEAVGESSTLFLDEALDGLDAQGKSEALRLLEEVARTKAVLIIDHTTEMQAAVNSVLRVVYRDGASRLEGSGTALVDGTSESADEDNIA